MICGPYLATICLLADVVFPTHPRFIGPPVAGVIAVDGDTIKAAGPWGPINLRIEGGESVERGSFGWQEAKDSMQAIVAGEDLACTIADNPSLGRQVATCLRVSDGADIMCEQIRAGHAEQTYQAEGRYSLCRPPLAP